MNYDEILGFDEGLELSAEAYENLPDGQYSFTYAGMERGQSTPKNPTDSAYPTAVVTLQVQTPEGPRTLKHTFKMLRSKEGLIGSFFASLGCPKNSVTGKVQTQWNGAIGKRGKMELKTRTFKGSDGNEVNYQNKNFIESDVYKQGQPSAQPAQPQSPWSI